MLGLRIKKTRRNVNASEYLCPGEGKGKPDFHEYKPSIQQEQNKVVLKSISMIS